MNRFAIALSLTSLAMAACGGDDHDDADAADVEACEHLAEGPYEDVFAAADADAPPAVSNDHTAYAILLPDGAPGYVSFAAAEATDYIFFFNQDVDLALTTADGDPLPIEASTTSSAACTTIKGRHVVELPVGTAVLELGPVTGELNLVIEEAAGHAHE